uniref:65 kDa invariant surface glycoprotein n=1 Tax=Trypanosoma congolense (strain IL3000) TaxID=1068625 RepID=G0UMB5_TRYCI|nr:conserved hypothetical protein [Trypanosoma congolense IL3000]
MGMVLHRTILTARLVVSIVLFVVAERDQEPANGRLHLDGARALCAMYDLVDSVGKGSTALLLSADKKVNYITKARQLIEKRQKRGVKNVSNQEEAMKVLDEAATVLRGALESALEHLRVIEDSTDAARAPAAKAAGVSGTSGMNRVLLTYCGTVEKKSGERTENNNCENIPVKHTKRNELKIDCESLGEKVDILNASSAVIRWDALKPKPASPNHRNELAEAACRAHGHATSTACTVPELGWMGYYEKAIELLAPAIAASEELNAIFEDVRRRVELCTEALEEDVSEEELELANSDFEDIQGDNVSFYVSDDTEGVIYAVAAVIPLVIITIGILIFILVRNCRPATEGFIEPSGRRIKECPTYRM